MNKNKWYESLFGLVILSVGLNVLSNFLYDRARDKFVMDERNKKPRNSEYNKVRNN